jgi:hypothetical protein
MSPGRGTAVALAVALVALTPALAARPPAPGMKLAPGQLPVQCNESHAEHGATGDGPFHGSYFSPRAKAWISAPACVPRWGNLEASPSTIVGAGQRVTVVATPTDGSNSAQYAPETETITWTFPGRRVSGCGKADLRCTVVFVKKAAAEWQWGEFHVTMPRTFFVDSPGSNCAGQHLCAGVATNAWSFVGVPPKGQSPPPPPPPPGSARLCLGGCAKASVLTPTRLAAGATQLTVRAACGGSSGRVVRARAAQAGRCAFAVDLRAKKDGDIGLMQGLEEEREFERGQRWEIMKELQTKIFELNEDVTSRKIDAARKEVQEFDGYIHSNAGSPDVVGLLQDADAGLADAFPAQGGTARARAAQAGGPGAVALFRSLTAAKPRAGDAAAYADALALATSPTESLDRGRARLLLSLSVIAGRRILLDAIDSREVTVASGEVRVPRGADRALTLEPTPVGRRALRVLGITGLATKVSADLTVRSDGAKASRAVRLGG